MNIVKHSTPEHIYESIDDITKLELTGNDEISSQAFQDKETEQPIVTVKPMISAKKVMHLPYPFNTYRILLTLLYGALFSYTVTFILHNLELSLNESVEPVNVLWIFAGFIMGCSQILISWEIWRPWSHAKKSICINWIAQCANFIMMMAHNVLYQEEMHRYYHGLLIFISIVNILLLASYGHRKAQVDRCKLGLNYLFKWQKTI